MPTHPTNRNISLLYTNRKGTDKEIRKITPVTIVSNNVKYLEVTLTKQVKDLYDIHFKSWKKVSEDVKFSNAHGSVGFI